ncbi:MAG: hypothetical protein R3B06_28685 [Kofleriaceae bacterium]
MTRLALLTSFVLAAAATACNPYDPDLGPTPFQCGGADNVCPEGYTCNTDIDVCERTGSGATIDAPSFVCANDSIEPNDMPAQALITPIPGGGMNYALSGVAICPATDVDVFRFSVDSTGTNLEVLVAGMADRGSLVVDLLNNNGTVIATGAPVNGTPQQVKIELSNRLAVGDYFLRVQASDAAENNYNLSIKTCTAPLPCP